MAEKVKVWFDPAPVEASGLGSGLVRNTHVELKDCSECYALQERVWAALVLLAAFETEMSFLLADVQESIRARSERAFCHLQRSIVVDEDARAKWKKAFDDGEVACERLGAVHLLLHGIWAFKVGTSGARTDLVFQEPAGDLLEAQRCADGFVLTEWKKAAEEGQANKRFEEARSQARRYAQGPLAAIELIDHRYAVVVSRRQVETPGDLREGWESRTDT